MDKGRFLTTPPGSHSSEELVAVCQGTQEADNCICHQSKVTATTDWQLSCQGAKECVLRNSLCHSSWRPTAGVRSSTLLESKLSSFLSSLGREKLPLGHCFLPWRQGEGLNYIFSVSASLPTAKTEPLSIKDVSLNQEPKRNVLIHLRFNHESEGSKPEFIANSTSQSVMAMTHSFCGEFFPL
ncbi:hypothetical protein ACRRTK_001403 [Alexandromys fortis]